MSFHQDDILLTELASYQRAEAAVSRGDFAQVGAMIRAQNRLLDACVAAGMAYDEADATGWAAKRAAKILCAA